MRAPDVVADEVQVRPAAPRTDGIEVVSQGSEVPSAAAPQTVETVVGDNGPCPQLTPYAVELGPGKELGLPPSGAPLQDTVDPGGQVKGEGSPDGVVLSWATLEGTELHAVPGKGSAGEGVSFSKTEAIGQGKANNRDATEVVVVSAVPEEFHNGGEREPVPLTRRFESQALAALREPPPGSWYVPAEHSQVAGALDGRNGEPDRGGREAACQPLEKKFLDQAKVVRRRSRPPASDLEET